MIAKADLPPLSVLTALLSYDPETGALTWKRRGRSWFLSDHEFGRWNTRYAGKPAFTAKNNSGYLHGQIFGKAYVASRIAWKMATGEDPIEVDHLNGDRADNRLANLRSVTRTHNNRNRTMKNPSGCHGVRPKGSKWTAEIGGRGRRKWLGTFPTKEEAVTARRKAEAEQGYYQRGGEHA